MSSKTYRPPHLRSHRQRKLPCGWVLNGLECLNPSCECSHEPKFMRAWKAGPGLKPCRFSSSCRDLKNNTCRFYHPAEDHDKIAQKPETQLHQGLSQKVMTLQLGPDEPDTVVRIWKDKVLSSFTQIGPNEIAIPGQFFYV